MTMAQAASARKTETGYAKLICYDAMNGRAVRHSLSDSSRPTAIVCERQSHAPLARPPRSQAISFPRSQAALGDWVTGPR